VRQNMKKMRYFLVFIFLILFFLIGYHFGDYIFQKKIIFQDKYAEGYKEFNYRLISTGDSSKVKLVYIEEDSLTYYKVYIKYSATGNGREALQLRDFYPTLGLEIQDVIIKKIALTDPLLMEASDIMGLTYQGSFRTSSNTFHRITGFHLTVESRRFKKR
jgi:hypothetical protein